MLRQDMENQIIIEKDCTAYIFTDEKPVRTKHRKPRTLSDRLVAELKSFLPTVARVRPVEARLASGQKLNVISPHRTH